MLLAAFLGTLLGQTALLTCLLCSVRDKNCSVHIKGLYFGRMVLLCRDVKAAK